MKDDHIEKYRQWVSTNFESDVKEQLFDIYKESMHEGQNDAGRISKTIAKASTLFARLSADQERTARKLFYLTWALLVVTVALFAYTVFLYKDSHTLLQHEQTAAQHEAHKP